MEDLSHITVPKMKATEGFPVLPEAVMASFSDKAQTDEATRLMGFDNTTREVADGEPGTPA